MTGKTHQILGLTTGIITYLSIASPVYNPATPFSVLFACHLSALLPDLDRPTAKIWQSFPMGHNLGHIIDPLFKHRNVSHSILGFVVFGFLLKIILNQFPSYWGTNIDLIWLSAQVAYASHLIADMFTVDGIPLLFPLKKSFGIPPKPLEGIRIETGKWFENLIIFPLLNLILFGIIWLKWETIKSIILK